MSKSHARKSFEVVFLAIALVGATAFIVSAHDTYAFHLPDENAGHSTPGPAPNTTGVTTGPAPNTTGVTTGPAPAPFTVQLQNPLKVNSIEALLKALLDILLIFAVPIIVFFLILSGFKFVMARGNDSELTAAKRMFTWTIVGGVLILGAWALVAVIQGTVNALR